MTLTPKMKRALTAYRKALVAGLRARAETHTGSMRAHLHARASTLRTTKIADLRDGYIADRCAQIRTEPLACLKAVAPAVVEFRQSSNLLWVRVEPNGARSVLMLFPGTLPWFHEPCRW